jgi:glucosamine--fructose-6-phosphate aminotransferase (isomerizing)
MKNTFLKEIHQQPGALKKTLDIYRTESSQFLRRVRTIYKKNGCSKVLFAGMGSSFFASFVSCTYLNEHNIFSLANEGGELLYYTLRSIPENTLIVAVSQSGESIETKKVIKEL